MIAVPPGTKITTKRPGNYFAAALDAKLQGRTRQEMNGKEIETMTDDLLSCFGSATAPQHARAECPVINRPGIYRISNEM